MAFAGLNYSVSGKTEDSLGDVSRFDPAEIVFGEGDAGISLHRFYSEGVAVCPEESPEGVSVDHSHDYRRHG